MHFQNIFRSIITSVVGTVIICLDVYFYFFAEEGIELNHGIGVLCIGAIFLLMPDDIPAFVRAIVAKFTGKSNTPPPPSPPPAG